ncbi:MAG TPA: MFS transporter [Bacillota bacterium]
MSVFGTAITNVAIPWLTLDLTGSAAHAGLMAAAGFVPYLLLILPSGVWVDRLDRRKLMVWADLARAALIGSIPLAGLVGRLAISQLYMVQIGIAACSALFDMGYNACLPNLVHREQLQAANSRLQATDAVAGIAGPALGGLLVGVFGAATTVSVDAISYLLSVGTLLAVRRSFQSTGAGKEPGAGKERPKPFVSAMAEGLRFLRGHRLLRSLAVAAVLLNLAGGMSGAVQVYRMKQELSIPADAVGLVFAVGGFGSLAAALVSEAVSRRLALGRILSLGLAFIAVGWITLALAKAPTVFMAAALLASFGGVVVNIQSASLRQATTPDRLLGRVTGAFRTLAWGLAPVGSIAGGFIAQNWGAVTTFWAAAIISSFGLAWMQASGLGRPARSARSMAMPPLLEAFASRPLPTHEKAQPDRTMSAGLSYLARTDQ